MIASPGAFPFLSSHEEVGNWPQWIGGIADESSGDVRDAGPTQHSQDKVTKGRKHLWQRALAHPAGIFTEGHITNVMHLVFNGPMTAADL